MKRHLEMTYRICKHNFRHNCSEFVSFGVSVQRSILILFVPQALESDLRVIGGFDRILDCYTQSSRSFVPVLSISRDSRPTKLNKRKKNKILIHIHTFRRHRSFYVVCCRFHTEKRSLLSTRSFADYTMHTISIFSLLVLWNPTTQVFFWYFKFTFIAVDFSALIFA